MMFHSSNSEENRYRRYQQWFHRQADSLHRQRSHGGAPHLSNALNAAMLGLMGIHAQRKHSEIVIIFGCTIITKGGDLVNIVPADVRMKLTCGEQK